MITRLLPAGRSFKGLALYLGHDPKSNTADRVAWTHTINCAHDHVPSAVHEMYSTAMEAELLKQEAGVRSGGPALEKPVKHFSLSWHPSEEPTREQMIAAVESLLKHMGWDEHQAILFGHSDKEHRHVHCMLNQVHPETGLRLDDGFEKRRMSQWALSYEREHGLFCEQRLLPVHERETSPDRTTWLILKESERQHERAEHALRSYDPDYLARDDNRRVIEHEEWKILKQHQREERESFFAQGRVEFNQLRSAIYRAVREEFRDEWREYYSERRRGADADELAATRADILERQKAALDERRTEACAALREVRDGEYTDLLASQKEMRAELAARQEQGLRSPQLLELAGERPAPEPGAGDARERTGQDGRQDGEREAKHSEFEAAADEVCAQNSDTPERAEPGAFEHEPPGITSAENPRVRDPANSLGDFGLGIIGGLAIIGERVFDGFFGASPQPGKSPPAPRQSGQEPSQARRENSSASAAEGAQRGAEREEEQNRRNRSVWEERERTRE
jgi:hypothetical protein